MSVDPEMQLLKEMDRGQQALDLISHPLMAEAFESIRQSYLTQWENSPARDTEGREKIWTYLKQLDALKAHLTTVMQTGKMAQEQRSLMERMKAGARSLMRSA
jgi:hypothetical protein